MIDEYTRECPAMGVARAVTAADVRERLTDLFIRRGAPGHVRSGNGPEFAARAVRDRLGGLLFLAPGSPWENGSIERFNGTSC